MKINVKINRFLGKNKMLKACIGINLKLYIKHHYYIAVNHIEDEEEAEVPKFWSRVCDVIESE